MSTESLYPCPPRQFYKKFGIFRELRFPLEEKTSKMTVEI